MKKPHKLSKLRISRETLRALHPDALGEVVGGSVGTGGGTTGGCPGSNNSCGGPGTCKAN